MASSSCSSSFFFVLLLIAAATTTTTTLLPTSSLTAAQSINNLTAALDLVSDACAIDVAAKERNFDNVKNIFERQGGLKQTASAFPADSAAATAGAVARAIDGHGPTYMKPTLCSSMPYRSEMIRKGVSGILLNLATDLLASEGDDVDTDVIAMLLGSAAVGGEPKSCTPVAKMDRRASEFGASEQHIGHGRDHINEQLAAMREAVRNNDAASASNARNALLEELNIAPVQGALKYAALIDPSAGSITYGELDKERAEAIAYIYPVMNQIGKCQAALGSARVIEEALSCSPENVMPVGVNEEDIVTTSRSVTDDGIYSRVLNAIEKAYSCLAVMSGDAAEFKEHVGIYRGERAGLTPEGFQD
uniref:Uncharacterized protein n=1 Tax=Pycnococcus provasolii TaxID=41880 RepID=A0A6U0C0W6_9CHLO